MIDGGFLDGQLRNETLFEVAKLEERLEKVPSSERTAIALRLRRLRWVLSAHRRAIMQGLLREARAHLMPNRRGVWAQLNDDGEVEYQQISSIGGCPILVTGLWHAPRGRELRAAMLRQPRRPGPDFELLACVTRCILPAPDRPEAQTARLTTKV